MLIRRLTGYCEVVDHGTVNVWKGVFYFNIAGDSACFECLAVTLSSSLPPQ